VLDALFFPAFCFAASFVVFLTPVTMTETTRWRDIVRQYWHSLAEKVPMPYIVHCVADSVAVNACVVVQCARMTLRQQAITYPEVS
jgi:uncharacterized membrane protein YhaH (DUF805 family)